MQTRLDRARTIPFFAEVPFEIPWLARYVAAATCTIQELVYFESIR